MSDLFFIANWKMNKLREEAASFLREFAALYTRNPKVEIGVTPPYTLLAEIARELGKFPGVTLGAQNSHWLESGAHTGEISIPMLKEYGVSFVVLGHSERRQFYGETSKNVALRAAAALRHGVKPVICVGETRAEYEAGRTNDFVLGQLRESLTGIEQIANVVIAYEPVWAIGTGLAASAEDARCVHDEIRAELERLYAGEGRKPLILYGGSTTAENVAGFTANPNVSGAIVGGASLKAQSFWELCCRGALGRGIS